ncbi:hypothetical protein B0F90DRAFT_1183591 [Multifurca ochricompacta]|uniref:Uncharacterized protein n=1 Tax=Multifurca ochricompacta TaxID=376703 RepID=A0AAD4M9W3_9AGAM|nr:hypothetical protein B0F90DRAFT_1183591 [Multifurca ochricompacta]
MLLTVYSLEASDSSSVSLSPPSPCLLITIYSVTAASLSCKISSFSFTVADLCRRLSSWPSINSFFHARRRARSFRLWNSAFALSISSACSNLCWPFSVISHRCSTTGPSRPSSSRLSLISSNLRWRTTHLGDQRRALLEEPLSGAILRAAFLLNSI